MKRCYLAGSRIALLLAAGAGISAGAAGPQMLGSSGQSTVTTLTLTPELRGDLAMARQQYLAAIEAYREAPANSAVIWNKLGIAYHHLFAVDEARRDYERALRLQPNYPEALNNLGAIYYAKHSYRRAEKLYEKAIRLNPRSASIYSNLGTDYFAERKPKRAIAAYEAAFALDSHIFTETSPSLVSEELPAHDRAEQDYCIAELFAQSGRNDDAISYLRRALNEGFDDRKKILRDETLASLRATPEFSQLMAEQKLR